ncbi:twin-arginine translocase TatA/TatE family subunit [Desulforamulus ruminis]|uniref:twin-arginine translocase TatA/TatE family subunit n=1 Tax=Desulforamulus ruminis TaxID=1564 RepID=UPI00059DCC90|nr:twin-arginine translocase TatA/TatE family subunit [Desulforamulus ruminis]
MNIFFEGLFQPTHLLLILIVVLIIFGPGKLPEVGKAMGKTINEFRRATSGTFEQEEKREKAAQATKEEPTEKPS